jgi:hypothetical protein
MGGGYNWNIAIGRSIVTDVLAFPVEESGTFVTSLTTTIYFFTADFQGEGLRRIAW